MDIVLIYNSVLNTDMGLITRKMIRNFCIAFGSMALGEMSVHGGIPQALPFHLQDLFFIGGILLGIALIMKDTYNNPSNDNGGITIEQNAH